MFFRVLVKNPSMKFPLGSYYRDHHLSRTCCMMLTMLTHFHVLRAVVETFRNFLEREKKTHTTHTSDVHFHELFIYTVSQPSTPTHWPLLIMAGIASCIVLVIEGKFREK